MSHSALSVFNARQSAELLDFPSLVDTIEAAAHDLAANRINAPERQVVPYPHDGVMLSMPATAADIGIHKLVNVVPSNRNRQLATINGVVSAYNGTTGEPLFVLDGPTVTLRRTAAVSMLGLRTLGPAAPRCVTLIGSGAQADGHAQALAALYPGCRVNVLSRSTESARLFIERHAALNLSMQVCEAVADESDVVITLTTSATPVYNQPARANRLLIGVGAFKPTLAEIGATTLEGSALYVDDLAGARHEAGDFLQAGVDWSRVKPLASALQEKPSAHEARVFKTVGCAAWDLAAARCALKRISG